MESELGIRKMDFILLGILLAGVCSAHIAWTTTNDAPALGNDHYLYLSRLFSFLNDSRFSTIQEIWFSLGQLSVVGRPPLYQILTIPFIVLFGRSEDSALLINLIFISLLVIVVYLLGAVAADRRSGLLAACIVVCYAPVVHLSRLYLPHLAVSATAAMTLWLLLLLAKTRSIKISWFLGLSLAAGLMIHPYYAWVAAAPTMLIGFYVLLFQNPPRRPASFRQASTWFVRKVRDRFVILGLLPAALIAVGPFLLWYLSWGQRSFEQWSGQIARSRVLTIGFPGVEPSFWWYAQTAPGALSYPMCLFAIVGLVSVVIRPRSSTAFLLFTLVSAYSIYSCLPTRWWTHFVPILPVVAVLTAVGVTSLRPVWLRRAALAISLVVSAFNFFFVSWGADSSAKSIAATLGSPLPDHVTCTSRPTAAFCPAPPQPGRWPFREVLLMVSDQCQRKKRCQMMIVETPATPLFNYLLAKERIDNVRIVASSARVRSRRIQNEYNLDALFFSGYILDMHTGLVIWNLPEDRASRKFLESPPSTFLMAHREVGRFDLPGSTGRQAKLFKRISPVTAAEAEDSIAALKVPEKKKMRKFSVLARLYALEGDMGKARENFNQIADAKSRRALRHLFRHTAPALGETQPPGSTGP